MKITLTEITIAELVQNYSDNAEGGVTGYNGRLDIRPKFQREFVYKDDKRNAVIDTVVKGFPLNVMYWALRADGGYEVIGGQQRTISICQYVTSKFSIKPPLSDSPLYFHNLQDDPQRAILDYKLTVYICDGSDSEKLDWFKTINIAGEKLTDQELRNAVYSGSWVTDAKRYFSRTGGAAYGVGGDYLNGAAIRQDYLETVIDWISNGRIEDYMGRHQQDDTAEPLWVYFQSVITWARQTFPKHRKEMKGLDWGGFHRDFGATPLDPVALESEVARLMADEEVENKKGIYEYVLTRKERYLNLRTFSNSQKTTLYERQAGICAHCGKQFQIGEMEADHINPWHSGGKTEIANGQMLCREDNRLKSGK
jgi:hypothetical protein